MTSTLPGPQPTSVEDDVELVRAWADTAESVDALEVAAHLLAADPDQDEVRRRRRARLLLAAGRPADGLAALPEVDRDRLVRDRPRGWTDVVALACLAAQGDADALGALLRFGATLPTSHTAALADLLAAAAAHSGRFALADDAAHDVPAEATPFSVRRRVVARIRQRGHDPEVVAGHVLDCAQVLLDIQPPADEETAVVARVVHDLQVRQDPTGAALLTEALATLRPESRSLADLRRAHRAGRRGFATVLVVLAALAGCAAVVAAAVATGLPALVVAGVPAVLLVAQRARPAGVARRPDERDARALRLVRRRLRAFPDAGSRFAFVLTAACCGALVAAVAGLAVDALVAPGASIGTDPAWDLPFLALVLAGAVLGPPVLGRLRLWSLARRDAGYRLVGRTARSTDYARCVCWQAAALRGSAATSYVAWHLHADGPAPAAAADVPAAHPPEVRSCPDSGLRWLLVHADAEPGALLLRGTARVAHDVQHDGPGGYL